MKVANEWPIWLRLEQETLELFTMMQPFIDDDVAKSWGIDPW